MRSGNMLESGSTVSEKHQAFNAQMQPLRDEMRAMGRPSTLRVLIESTAEMYGDMPAIHEITAEGNRSHSAAKLRNDAESLARVLCKKGFSGKNIAVVGVNSYTWLVAFFCASAYVGTAVPIDRELKREALASLLAKADVAAVCCDTSVAEDVYNYCDGIPCFLMDGEAGEENSLSTLIAEGKCCAVCNTVCTEDMTAAIVFTSGTTGANKGVMLTHKNMTTNVYSLSGALPPLASSLSVLPMNHVYELGCNIFTCLYMHIELYINDTLRHLCRNIVAVTPQVSVVVPLFVDYIYNEISTVLRKCGIDTMAVLAMQGERLAVCRKMVAAHFGGNIPILTCGGAAVRPDYIAFLGKLGFRFFIGYGLTESAPIAALNLYGAQKPESVGIPLVENGKIKIENADGEGIGEILLAGDNIAGGYYKDSVATSAVFVDGWFHTGDYGKLDGDGELCVTGRKKNLIVLDNGKNVSPEIIERHILCNVPVVREAVVFESKKEYFGQVQNIIAAAVSIDPSDLEMSSLEEKMSFISTSVLACCASLPPYMKIRDVVVYTREFKKNATKKIIRSYVIDAYQNQKGEVKHA